MIHFKRFPSQVISVGVFSLVLIACSSLYSTPSRAFDLAAFKTQLADGSATVEVHGIDTVNNRYVVTARGSSFFDYQHFALLGSTSDVWTTIKGLKRHDKIKLRGQLTTEARPFLHINASEVAMVTPYSENLGKYEYKVKLPDDLLGRSSLIGKVHASHGDGKMLVVDYNGTILPVLVPASHQTAAKAIARGDIVKISYELRDRPTQITHLNLKEEAGALEVLEAISAQHGKTVEYSGDLVLFPKSPQVLFNVFAFQKVLADQQTLEYTIVNFDSPELFERIRSKLQAAWDGSTIAAVNDRNKLLKRGLVVTVKGTVNFQDPNQANPQVIVQRLEDVTIR